MSLQEGIVFGILALSVVLIVIRIKRYFTKTQQGDLRCTNCPIYEQCASVLPKKKTLPPKECPHKKKSSKDSPCGCK